jgi:hypothetical protein
MTRGGLLLYLTDINKGNLKLRLKSKQEFMLVNEWVAVHILPYFVKLPQYSLLMSEFITAEEYKY